MFAKSPAKTQERPSEEVAETRPEPAKRGTPWQFTRTPSVDVRDTDEALVLVADLPGVDQDHLEITIHEDRLTLRGEVAADALEGFRPLHREYQPAAFAHAFTLPAEIDGQSARAALKHGVLTLTLPKRAAVQPRRITVGGG